MSENDLVSNGIDIDAPQNYINRELGLLEFQRRVLEEAEDEDNPLLERVKFLSILGSNLDEFFMVRVGGLKMQNDSGMIELSIDGKTPAQQLASIRKTSLALMDEARKYFNKVVASRNGGCWNPSLGLCTSLVSDRKKLWMPILMKLFFRC